MNLTPIEYAVLINFAPIAILLLVFFDALGDQYGRRFCPFHFFIIASSVCMIHIGLDTVISAFQLELNVLNVLSVFFRTLFAFPVVRLLLAGIEERTEVSKKEKIFSDVLGIFSTIVVVVGKLFLTDIRFDFSFLTISISLYNLLFAFTYICIYGFVLYLLIRYYDHLSVDERFSVIAISLFTAIALAMVRSSEAFYNISAAIAVLWAYLVLWKRRKDAENRRIVELASEKEKSMKQDLELENSRVTVALSQIQPHFMFNCLSSIQVLCEIDPKRASVALRDFSQFMRSNMDAMSSEACIPFTDILDKIDCYVRLEQIRFGSKLNVEYEIQDTDFEMPCMILQPIVENAIRHGVGEKHGGGTVLISSWIENGVAYVTVKDDGVGIDADSIEDIPKKHDGKSHVGIANVRARLEALSNGTIDFYSRKDVGTTVTIRIPVADHS